MTGFEPFTDKGGAGAGTPENPVVTINASKIHLGVGVVTEYLDDTDQIEWLIDNERGRLGIRPVNEDETVPHAYSCYDYAASARSLWDEFGIELEESHRVPLDIESQEFPVLDLSAFIDTDGAGERSDSEGDGSADTDDEPVETADESGDPESEPDPESDSERAYGLDTLGNIDGIGVGKIDTLRENGFETLTDIREASVADVAIDGVLSTHYASRIRDYAVDVLEGDVDPEPVEGGGEPVLDHERISTALDAVGVDPDIASEAFIAAVDGHSTTYEVGDALGVSRVDAADLIRRLELKDALDSDDGLAISRFEGGEEVGA